VLVQVIFWFDPTVQLSPPLGEVTVIEGRGIIENTASLVSAGTPSEASLTLIKQLDDTRLGTVQGKLPVFDVFGVIVVQELPLFVESSSRTLAIDPVDVQVIVRGDPTSQFSPPLGEVTLNPTIVNVASLVSAGSPSAASLTRTLQFADGSLGMSQL
jgi:hypothetical protein